MLHIQRTPGNNKMIWGKETDCKEINRFKKLITEIKNCSLLVDNNTACIAGFEFFYYYDYYYPTLVNTLLHYTLHFLGKVGHLNFTFAVSCSVTWLML